MRSAATARIKSKVRVLKQPKRLAKKATKKLARVIPLPVERLKGRALSASKRDELVLSHRENAGKLARSILRRWHARLDLEEVQSIVDLSLCEAVKNFNPRKGASFMTFLYYHLRGNLIRAVSTAASANGLPIVDLETKEDVENESYSFSSTEVTEGIASRDELLPDEICYRREMIGLSQRASNKLDELEREVVKRVFLGEQQLMDIAHSLGYSRCHISRVKKQALETLFGELRVLRGFDDSVGDMLSAIEEEEKEARRPTRRTSGRRAVTEKIETEAYESVRAAS